MIYLVTAHESPECVKDMIRNILHFNSSSRTCVVVNGSPNIQDDLSRLESEFVRVVPRPRRRREGNSFDVLKGYLEGGEWCRSNGLRAKYVILLASNCMFWKPLSLPEIIASEGSGCPGRRDDTSLDSSWHWPTIHENKRIIAELHSSLGLRQLQSKAHEGTVYQYGDFMKISCLIEELGVERLIDKQTVFEEFLLASLYEHITGRSLSSICRVFWEKPNYTPTIREIEEEVLPCVKRVARRFDDGVREWLRRTTLDYQLSPL